MILNKEKPCINNKAFQLLYGQLFYQNRAYNTARSIHITIDPILNRGVVLNRSLEIGIPFSSSAPLFCRLLKIIIITMERIAVMPI